MSQKYEPHRIELRVDDKDPERVLVRNPQDHQDRDSMPLSFAQRYCQPVRSDQADPHLPLSEIAESRHEDNPNLALELERLHYKYESGKWSVLSVFPSTGKMRIEEDVPSSGHIRLIQGVKSDLERLTEREGSIAPDIRDSTTLDAAHEHAENYIGRLHGRAARFGVGHRIE